MGVQLFDAPVRVFPFASNVHLCHYAGGYYSYLMCRVYAQAVWRLLFASDPLSRQAGKRYVDSILRYGGAKEPRLILKQLFGEDLMRAPIAHFISQTEG